MEFVRAVQLFTLPDVVQTNAALNLFHVFGGFIGVFRIRADDVFQLADFENKLPPFVKLQ